MKKTIIAAVVGGIILFLWQFVSWAAANLHEPSQRYTDKQQAIMEFLNSQQLEEGGYILPMLPRTASAEEREQFMKDIDGKPWASVQYHKAWNNNMAMSMTRGLIINIITAFLFCWIVSQFKTTSFRNVLIAAVVTGLIAFFYIPYTNSIWYDSFDIWAHLGDAVIGWGLFGAWAGWWMSRKQKTVSHVTVPDKQASVYAD